jgi:hypothetical protein
MDFITALSIILGAAVASERATELIKPLYLKIKNQYSKTQYAECTKTEKEVMTILVAPLICIVARIGIDLPGLNESTIVQQLLAGLIASLGSNVLHALMSIVLAIKDSAEGIDKTE